jgi:NNP family nitrate/nitrite transporter-like MFS transporter
MGVAASGNSGTFLAALLAPWLAGMLGWHGVFGVMLAPVLLTVAIFALLVPGGAVPRSGPGRPSHLATELFREPSTYRLCFLYALTFGGFVGLCSFLPIFLHDEYGMDRVAAGSLTAVCGLSGSLARPFGGYVADRLGGSPVLVGVMLGMASLVAAIGALPPLSLALLLLIVAVAVMGFGNGVVFRIVSDEFAKRIGAASGIIGAAGGFGGFLLPSWLGVLKDLTGTYRTGFLLFSAFCVLAWVAARPTRREFSH